MKRILLVITLVMMSGLCCAWGPFVSKYICERSVERVWGSEVLRDCVPKNDSEFFRNFCEVNGVMMGAENYENCKYNALRGYAVHPALIPHEVFKDDAMHFDYYHCPIIKGSEKWWICGEKADRPAIDLADRWFTAAENAPNLCTRIYDFCVAGNYYADSESELHQVKFIYNDCARQIEGAADNMIQNDLQDWSSGYMCRFMDGRGNSLKEYRQRLGVGNNDVSRAVEYLVGRGSTLKDLPLQPKNSVIILANSVDGGAAQGLLEFLRNNSIDVYFSSAGEFERTRYNPRVIILGGQNSPEGVGGIVSSVLSRSEMQSLLAVGANLVFGKENVWDDGQKVFVVAGNEANDTRDAWVENRDMLLSGVRMT